MKKLFSLALVLVMIASLAVAVSAADTANWIAGNGYNLVSSDASTGEKLVVAKNSPVTLTENADGSVNVKHGGYYQDGKNWGGVASKELYRIDGLEITVKYNTIPEVVPNIDCWTHIGLASKPELFQVGNVEGNPGFHNLIRFSKTNWEIYDGIAAWKQIEVSEKHDRFNLVSGTTVTMRFHKNSGGLYNVYYKGDDGVEYKAEKEFDFDAYLKNGAYVVASASLIDSKENAFDYTVFVKGSKAADPLEKYKTEDPEPGVIKVYVNVVRVNFDINPVIEAGRTLVPLRAIFEALGAEITWDDATKTVTAKLGEETVKLTIGQNDIFKNGEKVYTMDVPAKIVGGRTLVPARAVSESFGASVNWVDETKSVVIAK